MIGIDIIEVDRVDTSEKFLARIARPGEIEYVDKSGCESLRHQKIAALFCVKEAVMKALEMGANSGVVFKDIELDHEPTGKPIVRLHGKAFEKYQQAFAGKTIEVSLSHTPNYAIAIAMIS